MNGKAKELATLAFSICTVLTACYDQIIDYLYSLCVCRYIVSVYTILRSINFPSQSE